MKKTILLSASIFGFLSVLIGAMGAHYLTDILTSYNRLDTFETAVRFQFYHTFLLLVLGLSSDFIASKLLILSSLLCVLGIILFSGSLYLLCLTNLSWFGVITPVGGLMLMLSWFMYFYSLVK